MDADSGELRRNGTLVRLPPQPFQILQLLVDNAGKVIDRDRIRQEVWGETAVDFDRSLNVAIAQIRSALNDDATSPRFVQTIPRRGYRFLAKVEGGTAAESLRVAISWRVVAAAVLTLMLTAILSAAAFRYWPRPNGPIRIAVLPSDKLALGPADAVWSDGLFDDLLTELGGIQPHRLEVIGRRSVYDPPAGVPRTIRDLGRRLDVAYILESSVRREGSSLHTSVRLVDSGTEAVRWSAAFAEEDANDTATMVARVSAGVLTSLFPDASFPNRSAGRCRGGEEAFNTGRMLLNRGGLKDLQESLGPLQKAGCAPAMATQAEVLVRLAHLGTSGDWEAARSSAQAALAADPSLAQARLALGNIAFWHDWKWPVAQHEFDEVLRINPSLPDAYHDLAWLQAALGLRASATTSLETALALDPLSARTRMDSAWVFLQLGNFARAASEARRALELNPGSNEARFCIARALLYAGDATAALEALQPLMPQPPIAEAGTRSAQDEIRRLIEFQSANAKTDSYQRAWQLALLGRGPEAVGALEAAFKERNPMMPMIAADPAFRTIRDDPRFRALVMRMGL